MKWTVRAQVIKKGNKQPTTELIEVTSGPRPMDARKELRRKLGKQNKLVSCLSFHPWIDKKMPLALTKDDIGDIL